MKRLSGNVAVFIGLAAVVTAARPAETGSRESPPAAYSVGAAYDAARSRLVVFGGYRGQYVGDTWEWDGASWTRVAGSGPIARNGPAMVYDEARRQVLLFGGDTRTTGALGDTWAFDGKAWRQLSTSGPPARTCHAMVYDSRRSRVVLFGGNNEGAMLGDTWEWDGQQWTRAATDGPEARTLFGLAYDAVRGRTVLFGGTSRLAPDAPSHGDTWEWDGARWQQRSDVSGPSARDHIAMDYDPVRRVVVMHGGGTGPEARGETWTFDGRAWKRAAAAGPRRRFARLAFDAASKAMLLYGGFDMQPSNELWRFDGTAWEQRSP